ncbi:MAG TPA: hypothetical protein DHU96_24180 [Actinobacteria bacterium]|nr:hypothetical protein [Actinomycetota bacterium]
MNTRQYVVPAVLRGAMFVPRQAPGRREPAQVSSGAFTAAGLPVPAHRAQRNVYQLTGRRGLRWTPGLDAHIGRRGGELLGHGELILVDIDTPAAVDGTPMIDALRWLSDRAVEAGTLPDLSATVSVRTPGHHGSGHLPGWHLWYRADPAHPVRMGPLARCRAVELRTRGTCPGSPGYMVWAEPDQLPVIPRWIAGLAGPPPAPATGTVTGHGGAPTWARLHGIIEFLLTAQRGERNRLLFWASLRVGELVADGDLDAGAAGQALTDAAAKIGLVREDGQRAVAATIRSAFQRMGVAYEPAR